MRKGYASLVVVGVAACVAVYALSFAPKSNSLYTELSQEDMAFIKYTALYGKSYATKEEFELRSSLFKKSLIRIAEENSNPENTFTLAVNKFADWTPEQYKRLLGYKKTAVPADAQYFSATEGVAIPTDVDWRTQGAVNKIQDQGQCGSCWAFSATATTESRNKIFGDKKLYKLSEQQIVDCCTYGGSMGCNGGDEDSAFDYIRDLGQMLENDYPYTAVDGDCAYVASKTVLKTKGHTMVQANNALSLKTAIAAGPTSVAIEADTNVFQFYSGGILNSKGCGTNLDHAVVAVGYGVDKTKGEYYIVRNSWGTSWGLNGYVNIAIVEGKGICGIQMDASFANF
jgi:C1A family cysteine protease